MKYCFLAVENGKPRPGGVWVLGSLLWDIAAGARERVRKQGKLQKQNLRDRDMRERGEDESAWGQIQTSI